MVWEPTYEDVCSDKTGHAEAVEVEYDPLQVSYEELLDIFWNNYNPTIPIDKDLILERSIDLLYSFMIKNKRLWLRI